MEEGERKEKVFFSSPLLKTAGTGEGLTWHYPSGKDFPSKSEQEKLRLGRSKKMARRKQLCFTPQCLSAWKGS